MVPRLAWANPLEPAECIGFFYGHPLSSRTQREREIADSSAFSARCNELSSEQPEQCTGCGIDHPRIWDVGEETLFSGNAFYCGNLLHKNLWHCGAHPVAVLSRER